MHRRVVPTPVSAPSSPSRSNSQSRLLSSRASQDSIDEEPRRQSNPHRIDSRNSRDYSPTPSLHSLNDQESRSIVRGILRKMFFGSLALGALYMSLFAFAEPINVSTFQVSGSMMDVLGNNSKDLYEYPTDLTRNIVPLTMSPFGELQKPIHSHNDYWRDKPFWSALSVGAMSIEADVYLVNDTLYVGHERQALTASRTFQNLYVQPILSVLRRQNPTSEFTEGSSSNGVFDTDSGQTLYLWVDCKTSGPETFQAVIRELEPLRAGGWLTNYTGTADPLPPSSGSYNSDDENATLSASFANGTSTDPLDIPSIQKGAVTVIGTGNTPLSMVQPITPRDYFYDANLALLSSSLQNISAVVSPIASTDFAASFKPLPRNGIFNDTQRQLFEMQVNEARSRGIGARYWDTPGWPVSVRNKVWTQLWEGGVVLVNVDDLEGGAGFEVGDTL